MKTKEFNLLVKYAVKTIEKTLMSKGDEYADDNDRLHNFAVAARVANITKAEALAGMKLKHDVSVMDLIEWNKSKPEKITKGLIEEKLMDSICYNILLWAILLEGYHGFHKISKNL